jgi:hypothetical protein
MGQSEHTIEWTPDAERVILTVLANMWNMGGIVAIAELDADSQRKLAETAEINAMAQLRKALGDVGET